MSFSQRTAANYNLIIFKVQCSHALHAENIVDYFTNPYIDFRQEWLSHDDDRTKSEENV